MEELLKELMAELNGKMNDVDIVLVCNALRKLENNYKVRKLNTGLTTREDNIQYVLTKYVLYLKKKQLSDKTVKTYGYSVKRLCEVFGKSFTEYTEDDLTYYLMVYLVKQGNADTTRANEQRFLRSFFNFLYTNNYIKENPMAEIALIKVAKKDTVALTESEIVRLRDVAHKEGKNKTIYLALTDFLLSTGLRVGELCNLNKSDVNFETREVKVFSTKTNTYRTVYLNDMASLHLKDYLNNRTDDNSALFVNKYGNNRISRDVCENILHDIEHKAKINKPLTVHMFRRTFATKLCERGMDITYVSDLLGHSRIDTSRKYYIKCDKRNQKNSFMNCLN